MLPKFILGDNSEHPDAIYIIHTEYPRFVLNLGNDEVEWFDSLEGEDKEEATAEVAALIEEAEQFYDRELGTYS